MTEAQLLDEIARLLDSPPYKGRWPDVQKAFAKYTEHISKRPWWKRWLLKIKEV